MENKLYDMMNGKYDFVEQKTKDSTSSIIESDKTESEDKE